MTADALLVNATIVDVVDGATQPQGAVWIHAGRIRRAGPLDEVEAEVRACGDADPAITDMAGAHLVPGLINLHVHLGLALPGAQEAKYATEGPDDLALRMAANATATVRSGVTTVRLVGETGHTDFAVRRAAQAGRVVSPRIFTAGKAIVSTGGHGHDHGGRQADGPSDFRRATREQLAAGADLIKVMISGGIAGEHEHIHSRQITPPELRAVTDTAHGWGKRVTAHAGPAEAIAEGIDNGLDCIEHGYQLTDDVIDLMAAHATWYVPTILVSRCRDFYDEIAAPPWMVERALAAGEAHWHGLQRAVAAGVPIALGTDMPPAHAYQGTTATVREMEHLAEAGMSPLQVLQTATIRAAQCLGAHELLGSIEPGKHADLIALDNDPLRSVSAFRDLRFVMKAGEILADSTQTRRGVAREESS